jgi:hypothetical protein
MQENYQPYYVRRVAICSCEYEVLKPIHLPEFVDNKRIVWPEFEINPNVRIKEVAVKNGILYVLKDSSFMLWNKFGKRGYCVNGIRSLIKSSHLVFVADRETASRLEKELSDLQKKREEAERKYFGRRIH